MKTVPTYGSMDGVVLILLGLLLRYYIGRRRFNRRNAAGLQQFRSYREALWISAWERLSMIVANLLITAGMLMLASANMHLSKFTRYNI